MKILERYIFGSFLSSFALAFLVLTFVMTVGLMVQIVSLLLDGVSLSLVGEFAMVSFPETLQWTIPLSLLVSSVLVFSRLSADSEIAAMRACGVNIFSVIRYPVMFAFAAMFLGMWVNNEIVPRGHELRRNLKSKVSVGTGLDVLEPGRIITDFPKVKLYFGSKEGAWLHDLVIVDYSTPGVDRMIRASKARVESEGRDIRLELHSLTVDPLDAEHSGMARMNRYTHVMKDALKSGRYHKKNKDFTFMEVLEQLREYRRAIATVTETGMHELRRAYSQLKVEVSKRFVFALASLCFVLVGIPLGIRAQRKESSIGMAISLAIAIGYYLVVMLMLSLDRAYRIYPEVLIFLPVVVCMILACRFLRRHL